MQSPGCRPRPVPNPDRAVTDLKKAKASHRTHKTCASHRWIQVCDFPTDGQTAQFRQRFKPVAFSKLPCPSDRQFSPISGCSSGVDAQAIIPFCSHCKGLISYSKEQTSLPDRKYRCPQNHQPIEIIMKFSAPPKTRRKARKGIISDIRTDRCGTGNQTRVADLQAWAGRLLLNLDLM